MHTIKISQNPQINPTTQPQPNPYSQNNKPINMDWKNKLPQIQNKLRFQLFSRKYDGMERVFEIFSVIST